MPLDACTLTPVIREHDQPAPHYRGRMPNQPEPEIIQAAADIGVDPQALRDLLDAGPHQHADDHEPDDGPGLAAELAGLEPS